MIVEADVSEFPLGVDDNHGQVYIDGPSSGMVVGGSTNAEGVEIYGESRSRNQSPAKAVS